MGTIESGKIEVVNLNLKKKRVILKKEELSADSFQDDNQIFKKT